MAATTTYKRALLRRLHRSIVGVGSAPGVGGTLKIAIESLQDARIDATSTGSQIVSTSSNGHSVTFAAPGGSFSQEDLVETTEELLTKLEDAASSESLDSDDEGNNDALLAAILLRLPLHGARQSQSHFGCYRP